MQLADAVGLARGNGLLVNVDMQTSHNGTYTIGEVSFASALAPQVVKTPIRIESVHNIKDKTARAAPALTGTEMPARRLGFNRNNMMRICN